jgi:hypothetical protein
MPGRRSAPRTRQSAGTFDYRDLPTLFARSQTGWFSYRAADAFQDEIHQLPEQKLNSAESRSKMLPARTRHARCYNRAGHTKPNFSARMSQPIH